MRIYLLLKGSISNWTGFCLILCYWLMKYLLQSHVVFTIYLYLFHFDLYDYILPRRVYFFNPVYSAVSEMHQRLALQFYRAFVTCPDRITARLLAIIFFWSPQWIQANSRTVNWKCYDVFVNSLYSPFRILSLFHWTVWNMCIDNGKLN
jgi:hypothetical protein